ncbi:MAG: phosphatidate cytidylyltransferase [Planctomycetaceae bacterium]|nr:phosphatidate cytidylyltransferase [Planctomycetaceae bacterium]
MLSPSDKPTSMAVHVPSFLLRLPPEVSAALGGILIALIISSVIVRFWGRGGATKTLTEVRLRIRTWWVISGLFGTAVLMARTGAIVFLAFVSFLALKEYLSLIPTRRADRRVLFWAYLAIPVQYFWISQEWYGMFIIFIPVYLFLLIPTRMVTIGDTAGFLRAAGTLHWGLMTTVFSLSHAAYLIVVQPAELPRIAPQWPSESTQQLPGPGLLVLLVMLTQLNDVLQFLWGKSIGRIRVVPTVSPGKTLGGLLGGVATTTLLAWLIGPHLTFLDGPRSLLAGLIISVSGFAGDVSISALKRDLGVKDSGSTLPGHGGILDRVDSLTYAAPLFFHFVWYCYC